MADGGQVPLGNGGQFTWIFHLTGEKVIDDADFRDKLKNVYRNTIGGEMESAGIFAAANDTNTPWLIIKGICDFADGNKEKNKEMNQVLAIKASVSFALHFFSNRYAFNDLSFKPLVFYRSRPLATEPVKLSSVISFLDSYSQSEDKAPWQQLRVSAREITQTEGDKSLKDATTMVMQLVPGNTLRIFEDRIQSCWNDYNTVLASPDGYLPDEVERFTTALMRCICRELKRLITLNGGLPSNPMFAGWWNQYHCI